MDQNWKPTEFKVGQIIRDIDRPKWGHGVIIADRTRPKSPTSGQRLYIDFENRGLTTVYTALRVLKEVID